MPDDKDKPTHLVQYPNATDYDAYIPKVVKIESGAKSALDPNSVRSLSPYLEGGHSSTPIWGLDRTPIYSSPAAIPMPAIWRIFPHGRSGFLLAGR